MFEKLKEIDVLAWMSPKIRVWVQPAVLIFVSAAMLIIAVFILKMEGSRDQKATVVTGTVVGFHRAKRLTCPIIQYADADGAIQKFRGNVCETSPTFKLGDRVPVNIVPGYSPSPRIDGVADGLKFLPLLFAAMWLYLAIRSVWSAWKGARSLQAPARPDFNSTLDTDA